MTKYKRRQSLLLALGIACALLLCTGDCSNEIPPGKKKLTAGTGETPDTEEDTGGGGTGGTEGTPSKGESEVGIPNVGNTCYLNSTMQILTRLYPTVFDGETDELSKSGKVIADKISNKQAISREDAQRFYEEFLKVKTNFARGRQEDAQEALDFFLDRYLSKSNSYTQKKQIDIHGGKSKFGELEVNKSDEWEMLQLPLDHTKSAPVAMSDLLDEYLKDETVEDYTFAEVQREGIQAEQKNELETKYQGYSVVLDDRQTKYRIKGKLKRTEAKLGFGKLPHDVLPVQLKRFSYDQRDGTRKKIGTAVADTFRLKIKSGHILGSPGDKFYDLAGFIHHLGTSTDSGHYIAYAHDGEQWLKCDDSNVAAVSNEEAERTARNAYLYFYKLSS